MGHLNFMGGGIDAHIPFANTNQPNDSRGEQLKDLIIVLSTSIVNDAAVTLLNRAWGTSQISPYLTHHWPIEQNGPWVKTSVRASCLSWWTSSFKPLTHQNLIRGFGWTPRTVIAKRSRKWSIGEPPIPLATNNQRLHKTNNLQEVYLPQTVTLRWDRRYPASARTENWNALQIRDIEAPRIKVPAHSSWMDTLVVRKYV